MTAPALRKGIQSGSTPGAGTGSGRSRERNEGTHELSEIGGGDMTHAETHAAANGWIRTYCGMHVKPYDLRPEVIFIVDIAHALARICRFGGHVAGFVTVAAHSIEVSWNVPPEMALTGLLHDASEAYLGDMVRPLKRLPAMKPYRDAEERAHRTIAEVFGTIYPHPVEVLQADYECLLREIESQRDNPQRWDDPALAADAFLARFRELTS